jgi:hypothetical protein
MKTRTNVKAGEDPPREFSTGSFGWYFTGKLNIVVNAK